MRGDDGARCRRWRWRASPIRRGARELAARALSRRRRLAGRPRIVGRRGRARARAAAGRPRRPRAGTAPRRRAGGRRWPPSRPFCRPRSRCAARSRRRGDVSAAIDATGDRGGLPAGPGAPGARAAARGGARRGGGPERRPAPGRPTAAGGAAIGRAARCACCARRSRSIRRTTAPSSGCARCSRSSATGRGWPRRWPPGSRWPRIRSRSPRSGWRAPSCWRASSAIRRGAREELEAILHKQPEHARALARLSELLWEARGLGRGGRDLPAPRGGRAGSAHAARDLLAPRPHLPRARPRRQARDRRPTSGCSASTPTTSRRCARCPI